MTRAFINHGDVFVRQYGSREQIHVFVPRLHSHKRNYMRLSGGSVDSTWQTYREDYEQHGWRYVGTVPLVYLNTLEREWTLRSKWSEMKAKQRIERLQEAIDNGFIEADEVEPDHIEIPEEPDRKWTDKSQSPKHNQP